jgi:hypothetical protein
MEHHGAIFFELIGFVPKEGKLFFFKLSSVKIAASVVADGICRNKHHEKKEEYLFCIVLKFFFHLFFFEGIFLRDCTQREKIINTN